MKPTTGSGAFNRLLRSFTTWPLGCYVSLLLAVGLVVYGFMTNQPVVCIK